MKFAKLIQPPPFETIPETPEELAALPFGSTLGGRVASFWTKEPETIAWIESFTGEKPVFWDIGANIGLFSLYCAYLHKNAIVYAFEPHKGNFNRLCEHLTLNNVTDRAFAYCYAILDAQGPGFFDEKNDITGTSEGQVVDYSHQAVLIETIDNLTGKFGCPNHIKIDVDGPELRVLQGATRTLQTPELHSLLIEMNKDGQAIAEMLYAVGFRPDNLTNRKTRAADNNVIWSRS